MKQFRVFLGLVSISLLILVSSCTLGPEMGGSLKVSVPVVSRAFEPGPEITWSIVLEGPGGVYEEQIDISQLDPNGPFELELVNIPTGDYELIVMRAISDPMGSHPELGPTELWPAYTQLEIKSGDNEVEIQPLPEDQLYRVIFFPDENTGGTGDPWVDYVLVNTYAILPEKPEGWENIGFVFEGWSQSPAYFDSMSSSWINTPINSTIASGTSFYAVWSST